MIALKFILLFAGLGIYVQFSNGQCPMHKYRRADASGNNGDLNDADGKSNTFFQPELQQFRPDTASNLANSLSKPPARRVSNYIFYQGENEQAFDEYGLTHMVMQWGQFVDHDLTETRESGFRADIMCDANDLDFPGQVMEFTRAAGVGNDDGSNVNAITHFLDGSNIYGSDSSTLLELRDVATSTGLNHYLLKMTKEYDNQDLTRRQLLPIRINTYNEEEFYSGDIRTMEQPGLTALHTLFAREHNRLAGIVHDELYPGTSVDELDATDLNRIFDEARLVVEATMQKITYEDWLPALTGRKFKQDDVDCNNPDVSPNIMTLFSGAFFRVGHTMVNNEFWRFDTGNGNANRKGGGGHQNDDGRQGDGGRQGDDGRRGGDGQRRPRKRRALEQRPKGPRPQNSDGGGGSGSKSYFTDLPTHPKKDLLLSGDWPNTAFFDSVQVFRQTNMNIDPILAGLVYQPNQAIDTLVVPALRSHLFESNPALADGAHTTAFDLVARNIQRGRDLGIDSYVDVRAGLLGSSVNAVTSWEDITQNGHTIQKLKNLYGETGWDKLDLYVGMLLERHEQGSSLGRTLRAGIELQFSILQQGDCLWYTKTLGTCGVGSPLFDEKLAILTGSRTLAGVLRDNTGLDVAPNYNVFQTRHSQGRAIQPAPQGMSARDLYDPQEPTLLQLSPNFPAKALP